MDQSALYWMLEPVRRYAQFDGRARRKEYWWFTLFVTLVAMALTFVDFALVGVARVAEFGVGPIAGIFSLALIVPGIAVSIRRMHDLDKSGWWLLVGIIPFIGGLIVLFWNCSRGTAGPNRFGADPLAGEY